MKERELKKRIGAVLKEQGFKINPHIRPAVCDRQAYKDVQNMSRLEQISSHRDFLKRYLDKAQMFCRSGNEINPDRIELELREIRSDSFEDKLFRWWNLAWWTIVANADTIGAGEVCQRVQSAFGNPKVMRGPKQLDKYNQGWHIKCWAHFAVRPSSGSANPDNTDSRYCIYDKRHNDYGYTDEWVNLLIEKFKDDRLYDALYASSESNSFVSSTDIVGINSRHVDAANEHASK